MARKATPRKSPQDKLIDAALDLAAEKPWPHVSMTEIAEKAKLSLVDAYDAFPCRSSLVLALIDRHDRAMLAGDDPSLADESRRDRLFDAMMRRFEAMRPHRKALQSMSAGAIRDVDTVVAAAPRMTTSAKWMLRTAGIPADGPLGFVRAKALLGVYACAARAFFKDESEDLSGTMKALDQALKRVGGLI